MSQSNQICSTQAAANFFLELAKKNNRNLTPMQLLKLLYIAQGWTLALLDRPLYDERIEAWRHGPVIPSIYHEFKHFGQNPIKDLAFNLDLDGQLYIPYINLEEKSAIKILNKVWSIYSGFSANELRKMTHQPDTPWQKSYKEGVRHIEISQESIKDYYRELLGVLVNA